MMKVATSDELSDLTAGSFFALAGLGVGTHAVFVLFTLALSLVARLQVEERKAVVILGSQKTLPVAVAVIDFLPDALGEKGLIVIPAILFHFSQIVFDAALAARWGKDADVDEPGAPEVEMGPASVGAGEDDVKNGNNLEEADGGALRSEPVDPATIL